MALSWQKYRRFNLADKKDAPFSFYQYWLNVSDDEALRYLALFTLLEKEEILSYRMSKKTQEIG